MASFSCLLWTLSALAIVGCGSRTALEDGPGSSPDDLAGGSAGVGGNGAGAGLSNYDPDVECPNVGCGNDETCEPAVLTSGHVVGWATVDGGDLYFTTNDPEGNNALIRVPICGGEEQVLLERERFGGEGVIAGDYLYVPVEEPEREVLRLAKVGGAPMVIHTHEAGDPYMTRAISEANGYVLLSQYSFDGGLVLNEINPQGKAHPLNGNLPDSDWGPLAEPGRGFLPNKPIFFQPANGDPYGALIGADYGIYRAFPFNPTVSDESFIEALELGNPVTGPLLSTGASEADLAVYFTSFDENWNEHQLKIAGGGLQTLLPETGGIMLAVDGNQLFGAQNRDYIDEYGDQQISGDIWQAGEMDAEAEWVFSTELQNAFGLEVHGESVYVRTTRAVVRFPKDCQDGDGRCRFHYEE